MQHYCGMLAYYFELAIGSLKRNIVLTALMVAAVGVGIGVCMTALTTLRAMSGDPIPDRSARLFVPQINAWDPARGRPGLSDSQFSYRDAVALMTAHKGVRQAAMYHTVLNVSTPGGLIVQAQTRATFADFFPMFGVPFRSGTPWGQKADIGQENVVVLSSKLSDRLFPHIDPVGRTIALSGHPYQIVGVTRPWTPTPRFYDLGDQDAYGYAFGESEDLYVPFSTAIDRQMPTHGMTSCMTEDHFSGLWQDRLGSGCFWVQFWIELPSPALVRDFNSFVQGYAREQWRIGAYHYPARIQLLNVEQWLAFNNVVLSAARVNTMIASGLLIVCLVNAIGLLLAKFSSRATELSVRRALGASQSDLFLQCFVETLILGLMSAGLGFALSDIGLWGMRRLRGVADVDSAVGHLYSIDTRMALIILTVAVVSTLLTGLYPTLRAVRTQPAWQLKIQ